MGGTVLNILGFLQSILLGPSAGEATNTVADAAEKIKTILTGELPPEKRLEAELKFIELQAAINAEEAKSTTLFISGWRPACGWLGVFGLGYAYIIQPILTWLCFNLDLIAPPLLDTEVLTTVLYGLLGFGVYRTIEKSNGSSNKH